MSDSDGSDSRRSLTATLDEYELVGKPTDVTQLEESSPQAVLDAFEQLTRWQTQVTVNGRDETLLVGERSERRPASWQLFHQPDFDTDRGFAGLLQFYNPFAEDDLKVVGFKPAGDGPDEDVVVERVIELVVESHSRTTELDTVLTPIRTAITDTDWEANPGDTSTDEWYQAMTRLREFREEYYDEPPSTLPVQVFSSARVMHGLARYPLNGDRFMSHITTGLEQSLEEGLYDANPEALRELLFDFYRDLHRQQ